MNKPEVLVPRLFSYGFRPLFLCTVISAVGLIGWWTAIWYGWVPGPTSTLPRLSWHGHEMLFGFVGSAIGGFLLTAVANWTRRPPVGGLRLAMLVSTWFAARIGLAWDASLSPATLMLIDASYWVLLTAFMAQEVLSARNYRNLKIVAILAAFLMLNLLFHLDAVLGYQLGSPDMSIRATIFLVCVLISVIGGRIIPAFTGNWLRQRFGPDATLPAAFNVFDGVVIAATVIAGVCYASVPASDVTGIILLLAGTLQLARLSRWQGHRTFADPLVIVLHVGYAWLGAGMLLLASGILWGAPVPSAGLHALGVGAMAGLIVAVSSRAALGHTNRPLVAGYLLSTVFVLINLAAIGRVLASALDTSWLMTASLLWITAFLLFAFRIGPVLLGPPAGREFPERIQ